MHFKIIIALSIFCLVVALKEQEIQKEWFKFQLKYGKAGQRSLVKNNKRYKNFKENLEKINKHNKLYEQGLVSYKMAINPFSDLNLDDMERNYMGLKMSEK